MFDYDKTSPESILQYAKKLEGRTFLDVLEMYCTHEGISLESKQFKDASAKGQLGNFLEKYYFGYDPNGKQEADFKEAGVELKQTCIDVKKDGSFTAGERLSVTNISYNDPVEPDFDKSHVWEKIRRMLLVHYIRNKMIDRLSYEIRYVNLFTPPREDLDIIIEDYKKIIGKIEAGKAHEISESDTLYLGACTKGSTAEKSTRPQYYGDHTPARKRNFCLKRQYMDYVLHQYVMKDAVPYESVIKGALGEQSFEEIVLGKIRKHIGQTDKHLCELYDREYNNNKAQWVDLTYRMLGIKGNHAEEFEKANIVVKAIRLEENGKMRESMSFPPFKFCDLVRQEWENSDVYEYFSETKFLFVVFKKKGTEYVLRGAKFWNMPTSDLDGDVRIGWERIKDTIAQGVKFTINPNGTVSNNLPVKKDNRVIHIRPHAKKAAYDLGDGFVRGDIERDANPLPDGRWMTTQSFWINNDYIMEQIKDIEMVKKNDDSKNSLVLMPDEILERLSCYHRGSVSWPNNHENIGVLLRMIKGDCLSKRYACVHITSRNEKVAFFYDKPFVYDDMKYMNDHVSCRVICQDNEVENITVKDIWDLFYDLSERDPSLVACASLVFYHLLYKTYHKELDLCLELENWMADTSKNVNAVWIMPVFPKDVIRALDERIGGVRLAKGSAISFEAFVYYWELRFINEEYSPPVPIVIYREKPSVPLRERICNLVIRIADYYMGTLSYGALLEMTANGLMDKPCKYHEISAATKGAVHSAVEELIKVLREEGVSYKEHYVFHVEGRRYTSVIAIPDKRVYLHSPFQNSPRGIIDTCDRFGNRHFFLSNIKDRTSFEEMASRVLMYAKEK